VLQRGRVVRVDAVRAGSGVSVLRKRGEVIMSEIKFEIVKKIGVLSKSASGWEKQLNLMRWNDRDPKYDIREWSPDGEKMGKGVTLSKEELLALKGLLEKLEPE